MLELLSPAGSMEALHAAVQNGADAVYLGTSGFNARMGARNFSLEELSEAVRYCHIRGVKVHLTLNTLALDRELDEAAEIIVAAAERGVDAFIVQDLGLVSMCRALAPQVEVHASTQMSIHSLAGVAAAAGMGCSRAVLARELSRNEIARIAAASPIEIEAFGHGALCMCYSGQCYFSSIIGRRSGNRGGCAQPCRMCYGYGRYEDKYPLSLKDNCLVQYVKDLEKLGVASLKIEGRMKRPEYVAIVTRIYRAAIDGREITEQDLQDLERAFSREGFTQGYYEARLGRAMLGTHKDEPEDRALFARARATYEQGEAQRVPIRLHAEVRANRPIRLKLTDPEGREIVCEGPAPEASRNHALLEEELRSRLSKTGGTPYYVNEFSADLDSGLNVPASVLNGLRRDVLSRLTALRGRVPAFQPGRISRISHFPGHNGAPSLTVSVRTADQITPDLLALRPAVLYVPLDVLCEQADQLRTWAQHTTLCAALPRIIWDSERDAVREKLTTVHRLGVDQVLCGTIGHIALVKSLKQMSFRIRGDYGLNLFNSRSASYYSELGLTSLTASFEMTLPQIRDLSKPLPTEILAYGRLPMMITENCLIRNRTGACACDSATRIVDRKGESFPILKEIGSCRSEIFNSKKLYLLDKLPQLSTLGLWALRLSFTTEHPDEISALLRDLARGGSFEPATCTRGLYTRGVE